MSIVFLSVSVVSVLLAVVGHRVFVRKRFLAFPVYREGLSSGRDAVAEYARNLCQDIFGTDLACGFAWCTAQRDDDFAEAMAFAAPGVAGAEMAQFRRTGVLGEWRVAVFGNTGDCLALVGLVESGDGFKVSFFQAMDPKTWGPAGTRPDAGRSHLDLTMVRQANAGEKPGHLAESLVGRLGSVRQLVEYDSSGIPRVDRQFLLSPNPARDNCAKISQRYDGASAVAVLLVAVFSVYSLYLTLAGSREIGQWSIPLVFGVLTGGASAVSGVLSTQDGAAANIDLGANVRAFAMVSLLAHLTTALAFGAIVLFAIALAGTSINAGNALPTAAAFGGRLGPCRGFLVIPMALVLSRIWLGASTAYYSMLRSRFDVRVFFNASRSFVYSFRFARLRAALDSLVSAAWEEAVFRVLIPSILLGVFFSHRPAAWYAIGSCVVISAILWSFMHSTRFTANPSYRFLELFLSGIALGAIAWHFGFGVTMLVHWLFNFQVNLSHDHSEEAN